MNFAISLTVFVAACLTIADFNSLELEKRIIKGSKHVSPRLGNYYVKIVNIAGQWNEYDEYCGGVIIDYSWVLTHKWCVGSGNETHLLLGNFSYAHHKTKGMKGKVETVISRQDTFYSPNDKEEQNGIALLKLSFLVPNKHWILRPCGYKTHHKDHKLGIVGTGATKEGSVVMPPFIKTMRAYDDGCKGKLICCHSHDGSSPARGDKGDPVIDLRRGKHDHHDHSSYLEKRHHCPCDDNDSTAKSHHCPCDDLDKRKPPCGGHPGCHGHRHHNKCVVGVFKTWDNGKIEAARLSRHMMWIKDTIASN